MPRPLSVVSLGEMQDRADLTLPLGGTLLVSTDWAGLGALSFLLPGPPC